MGLLINCENEGAGHESTSRTWLSSYTLLRAFIPVRSGIGPLNRLFAKLLEDAKREKL